MNLLKILLFTTLLFGGQVFAGSTQPQEARFAPDEIVNFAKDVERYAADRGALAFVIGRVGRPSEDLPRGIRYTHTAVAIYSDITLDDGKVVQGYAIHNLYQHSDDPGSSFLKTDYPVDFFWGAHELKAGIIIPTEEMQLRLIETYARGDNVRVHNPRYSVIANPFNHQYQNCTEHTLDVINSAIYKTTDKDKLKANAKAHFTPQRVSSSPFKLMLGSVFMDGVTTRDHKGRVRTTTFLSIGRYLKKYELTDHVVSFQRNAKVIKH